MFITGIVLGIVAAGAAFVWLMQNFMVVSFKLNGTFEAAQSVIKKTIPQFDGWGFPVPEWDFYKAQISKGLQYQNIKNMVMYFVCKPPHANKVIGANPVMGAIMPCTWAVYETDKGDVFIAKMNIALMSKMYFGVIGSVMRDVAASEKLMLLKIREELSGMSNGEK